MKQRCLCCHRTMKKSHGQLSIAYRDNLDIINLYCKYGKKSVSSEWLENMGVRSFKNLKNTLIVS